VVAAPPLMEVPGALTSEVVLRITKPHRSSYVHKARVVELPGRSARRCLVVRCGRAVTEVRRAVLAFGTRGGIDGLGRSDRSFWR
jgi:hypothetical protein